MEFNGEQWNEIHQLDQSTIRKIYSWYQKPLFVEVREKLSEWIERRFFDCNLDSTDPSHYQHILKLIEELGAAIKDKASYLATQNPNSFTVHVKLSYAADLVLSGRPMEPLTLYQHIKQCLHNEREYILKSRMCQDISQIQVIGHSQVMSTLLHEQTNGISDMMTKYDDLKMKISDIARLLKQIHTSLEVLVMKANTLESTERTISLYNARGLPPPSQDLLGVGDLGEKFSEEKNQLERRILEIAGNINNRRSAIQELQNKLFDCTKIFKSEVMQCRSDWIEERVMTSCHVISIEQIEQWYDGFVQALIDFHSQMKEFTSLEANYTRMPLSARNAIAFGNNQIIRQDYPNQITQMLDELIQHALIVDTHPGKVQVKEKKFTVVVRFLIGLPLQLQLSIINVQALILNEEYNSNNGGTKPTTCGELVNSSQSFKLDRALHRTGHIAEFKKIQIKNFTRSRRKGDGCSVLDDSYWLLFQIEFKYNRVNHRVFALSVPIKIKCHPSQDNRCWESFVWDAADNFQKSDSVLWTQLAQILNDRFTEMTGKGLSPEQMKFVEDRVPGGINPIDGKITKAQFCRTEIPGMRSELRNSKKQKIASTFWNWFIEVAKFTSKHLCGTKSGKSGPWQDGLTMGFISSEEAVEILQKNGEPGTFLISFSDSQIGAITIVRVSHDKDVRIDDPLTSRDLTYRSLVERILENNDLHKIYPDKDKIKSLKHYLTDPLEQGNACSKKDVPSEQRTGPEDNQGTAGSITQQIPPVPGILSSHSSNSSISNSSGTGTDSLSVPLDEFEFELEPMDFNEIACEPNWEPCLS